MAITTKYIIIPIGGIGNRFKKENYKNPKALITINNKCVIYWLLDNIKISNNYTVWIPYNEKEYKSYEIVILDWQYIHLGKGVSDLVFLLVEIINFDKNLCNTIRHLYYKLYSETYPSYSYNQFEYEFNLSLCMFPFFVCVWFNSEEIDKLIDSTFPLRFIRNLEKYYQYYLTDFDFENI